MDKIIDIKEVRSKLGISQQELADRLGIPKGRINAWEQRGSVPKTEDYNKIIVFLNENKISQNPIDSKSLIPLFDDTSSVGGNNGLTADVTLSAQPTTYINAGDLFRGATAAIRHYGDSMTEYKSGCILLVKEVQDFQLVIWGKNYVIETSEYRITKKLGKGEIGFFVAHSTNDEKYPNGDFIHSPIDIPINKIKKLSMVLGSAEREVNSIEAWF